MNKLRGRGVLFILLVAAVLSACIGGSSNCGDLPSRIELSLTADSLTPASPQVCRGDEVTLVVTPEVDGVFHIHGYDEQVPATSITAGEVVEISFTAERSGQFPIELHTEGSSEGVGVGVFTVNEP